MIRSSLVALLLPLAACGSPNGSSGPCAVGDRAAELATSAAASCGSFDESIPGACFELYGDGGCPDGGLPGGLACALDAQAARSPFTLSVTEHGVDTSTTLVFVRTPAGRSYELSQGYSANFGGQTFEVDEASCASFAPDGGFDGLTCVSAGPLTTLCH